MKHSLNEEEVLLFIGHLGTGSNALSLFKGFKGVAPNTSSIDTQFFDTPPPISIRRVVNRIFPFIYSTVAAFCMSLIIKVRIHLDKPTVIFVYKGNWLKGSILREFDGLTVHFHPDDSSQPINRTRIFESAEVSYDLHFTTRIQNVIEIHARTTKPVYKTKFGYDKDWHFRKDNIQFNPNTVKIGFIGHARQDRVQLILKIASSYHDSFFIAGLKWNRVKGLTNLTNVLLPAYESEFSELVAKVPLQLGLLNSANRDQHTARTFEIPASGGLILAEDTREHREIFTSENYALFFGSEAELFDKIEWVVNNPVLATQIADNGHKLIINGGNSWDDRAKEMWSVIKENKLTGGHD